MCRWAAYIGEEVFLEDIVTAPCHSLIAQSHCAREAKSPTNGDGFGIAWYGDRPEPGLYRDILPAWSDPNLKSLCRQIKSDLFLAHVRASTGGATSRANCHPFVSGRWSFMHNGQIGGFERIRRGLESSISDELYDQRLGTTDSELFFLLMLDEGLGARPRRRSGAGDRAGHRGVAAGRHRAVAEAHRRLLRRRDAVCRALCHRRQCADALHGGGARRPWPLPRLGAARPRRRRLACHPAVELRDDDQEAAFRSAASRRAGTGWRWPAESDRVARNGFLRPRH